MEESSKNEDNFSSSIMPAIEEIEDDEEEISENEIIDDDDEIITNNNNNNHHELIDLSDEEEEEEEEEEDSEEIFVNRIIAEEDQEELFINRIIDETYNEFEERRQKYFQAKAAAAARKAENSFMRKTVIQKSPSSVAELLKNAMNWGPSSSSTSTSSTTNFERLNLSSLPTPPPIVEQPQMVLRKRKSPPPPSRISFSSSSSNNRRPEFRPLLNNFDSKSSLILRNSRMSKISILPKRNNNHGIDQNNRFLLRSTTAGNDGGSTAKNGNNRCQLCPLNFETKIDLDDHVKTCHDDDLTVLNRAMSSTIADVMPAGRTDEEANVTRMTVERKDQSDDQPSAELDRCHFCQLQGYTKLSQHVWRKHPTWVACQFDSCSVWFYTQKARALHYRNVHRVANFRDPRKSVATTSAKTNPFVESMKKKRKQQLDSSTSPDDSEDDDWKPSKYKKKRKFNSGTKKTPFWTKKLVSSSDDSDDSDEIQLLEIKTKEEKIVELIDIDDDDDEIEKEDDSKKEDDQKQAATEPTEQPAKILKLVPAKSTRTERLQISGPNGKLALHCPVCKRLYGNDHWLKEHMMREHRVHYSATKKN